MNMLFRHMQRDSFIMLRATACLYREILFLYIVIEDIIKESFFIHRDSKSINKETFFIHSGIGLEQRLSDAMYREFFNIYVVT